MANSADIIILTVAGDRYEGAPKFRVLADDKIIGTGEVSNAVDTATGLTVEWLNEKLENKYFSVRFHSTICFRCKSIGYRVLQ